MNHPIIPEVESLTRVCRDGEKLFRHAASTATSTHLQSLFAEYAAKRRAFYSELQNEAVAFGESSPTEGGTVGGTLRQSWVKLRDLVFTPGEQTLLDDAAREGEAARETYRRAIEAAGLPDALRDIVARQYAEIAAAHQYLCDLRDGSVPAR